jgi:hypothetical protein
MFENNPEYEKFVKTLNHWKIEMVGFAPSPLGEGRGEVSKQFCLKYKCPDFGEHFKHFKMLMSDA